LSGSCRRFPIRIRFQDIMVSMVSVSCPVTPVIRVRRLSTGRRG
jgi:hypothetical protein